jgi:hypothetical protein
MMEAVSIKLVVHKDDEELRKYFGEPWTTLSKGDNADPTVLWVQRVPVIGDVIFAYGDRYRVVYVEMEGFDKATENLLVYVGVERVEGDSGKFPKMWLVHQYSDRGPGWRNE